MRVHIIKRNLLFIAALIGLNEITSRADTLNLHISDQSGIPIAGVSITYSYDATPPASPGGGSIVTDLNGNARIIHPGMGGSSCILFSSITYNIALSGVTFSKSTGIVPCGPLTSSEMITAVDFPSAANVSSASYRNEIAGEMIVAMFGVNLAEEAAFSSDLGLEKALAGRQILIRDMSGVDRAAELIFVSPLQINYFLPSGLLPGLVMVRVLTTDQNPVSIASATMDLSMVAPGLYSANADGLGVAAALIFRILPDGTEIYEPVAEYDSSAKRFIALPVDLGPAEGQVFLVLLGTGWRFRSSLGGVSCVIGGIDSEVLFAGAQGQFAGLDQANIRLSAALSGRGQVNILFSVDGKQANTLTFMVR